MIATKRRQLAPCVSLLLALLIGCSPAPPAASDSPADVDPIPANELAAAEVPAKALKVLDYALTHQRPPDGYEGGRAFHNAERRLPQRDQSGRAITYHEWDVNPKVPGINRGAERLVTGSDGSAYYTSDHYRTFVRIR